MYDAALNGVATTISGFAASLAVCIFSSSFRAKFSHRISLAQNEAKDPMSLVAWLASSFVGTRTRAANDLEVVEVALRFSMEWRTGRT